MFAEGPTPAPPTDDTSVRKDSPKALCAITDKSGCSLQPPGSLWATWEEASWDREHSQGIPNALELDISHSKVRTTT